MIFLREHDHSKIDKDIIKYIKKEHKMVIKQYGFIVYIVYNKIV